MDYAGVFAAVMSFIAAYAVVGIAFYVILVIANWKIFAKAGEAGWKSLIPVYNVYTLYKITWKPMMFWILLACSVVSGILTGVAKDNNVLVMLGGLFMLAAGVIAIIQLFKMAKAFGKGVGYGFGLWFLSPIFTMILGFGSAKYVGPQN